MARFHFGPLHFDSSNRLLYKGAGIIQLPAKSGDILLLLLDNAGQLVLRETIRQEVWEGAFIEDDNLSKHLSVLQNILRAHMGEVEVIRTFPERGYQFVLHIRISSEPNQVGAIGGLGITPHASEVEIWKSLRLRQATLESQINIKKVPDTRPNLEASDRDQHRKTITLWVICSIILVIVTAIGLFKWHRSRAYIAASSNVVRPIAILNLRNLSGQADQDWFGIAIKEIEASALTQDGALRVIPEDSTADAEEALAADKMTVVDDGTLKDLAHRLDCDLVLTGSYLYDGKTLRLDIQLRNGQSGSVVNEVTRVANHDSLLADVTDSASEVRRLLNASKAGVNSSDQAVIPAKSADWVQPYQLGLQLLHQGKPMEAQSDLYRAALLNPSSAQVHSALAVDWSQLGYENRAGQEADLVLRLASSLPNGEKLAAEASAYEIERDWSHAKADYISLHQTNPLNADFIVGLADARIHTYEAAKALEELNAFANSSAVNASDPRVLLYLARTYSALANWREMLVYAGKAVTQARLMRSPFLEVRALELERTAWRSLGNAPAATADSLQVEKISLGTGDTQGIAAAMLMEAEDQFKNDDPACVSSFKRAIALEERLGADLTLATAYNNLGLYFAYHDDWIAARNSYGQSVSFASKANYPLWGVYGHANIGYADAHMDHLDEALVELRQTVLLAQKLHYADGEIPSRSFLAVAEIATGDLADARTQLDQSLTLAKSVGNTPFVANTERFLASLEIASDNLPKAHQLLTDASAMRVLSGPDLSGLQQTTALLALEEQQPASVTESMGRLATTGKTVIDAEEAWRLVAESWLMRGNLSQAQSAINRALELAHRSPDTHEYLIPASITEARIDAAGGDTTKALNELSNLLIRADQINDVPLSLEIRLRQGEIQRVQDRSAGDFSQSKHTLEAVFSDANKRGFKLIARKARAALDQR